MSRRRRARLGIALVAVGFVLFMIGPIIMIALGFGSLTILLSALLSFSPWRAAASCRRRGPSLRRRLHSAAARPSRSSALRVGRARAFDEGGYAACEYCGTRFTSQ